MSESRIQPQLRYGDLREWMREAERLGELRTVLGASWQEEIGLAADVVVPTDDGPAVGISMHGIKKKTGYSMP